MHYQFVEKHDTVRSVMQTPVRIFFWVMLSASEESQGFLAEILLSLLLLQNDAFEHPVHCVIKNIA
jgi:hypothetical protein